MASIGKAAWMGLALATCSLAVPAHAGDADIALDSLVENADFVETDRPVIRYGRAVDLAGIDIEPIKRGAAVGALPTGRPLSSMRLTSRFGNRRHPVSGRRAFHAGVDLAASYGTPVRATSAGKVVIAGRQGGYGILVRLDHGGAVESRYAHLSSVAVRVGDTVTQNQVIGYVGSTGRSTGPHLHYETRSGGRPIDPAASWR